MQGVRPRFVTEILDLVIRCFAICFKGSINGGSWPGLFRRSINEGIEVGDRISDISKCAERHQDPAVEKRFMGLDSKTAAVHPREFVERDGLHIDHRRDGANGGMTIRCCQMNNRVADFLSMARRSLNQQFWAAPSCKLAPEASEACLVGSYHSFVDGITNWLLWRCLYRTRFTRRLNLWLKRLAISGFQSFMGFWIIMISNHTGSRLSRFAEIPDMN